MEGLGARGAGPYDIASIPGERSKRIGDADRQNAASISLRPALPSYRLAGTFCRPGFQRRGAALPGASYPLRNR